MHIVHVIEVGVPLIAVGAFAYTRTKHSAQHQGARQATRRLGIGAGFVSLIIIGLILLLYLVLIASGGPGG